MLIPCIINTIRGVRSEWRMGIGDWAIPNPQSPIPKLLFISSSFIQLIKLTLITIINNYSFVKNNNITLMF